MFSNSPTPTALARSVTRPLSRPSSIASTDKLVYAEHMKGLGKLKRVPLRDVWVHEAHAFATWLAEETNLGLLADLLPNTILSRSHRLAGHR